MQRNKLEYIAVVASCAGLFLFGQPVLASEASAIVSNDGRLLFILILQIVWGVGVLVGGGLALWSYMQLRQSEDDLLETARLKKLMLIGMIATGISLLLFIVTSVAGMLLQSPSIKAQKKSAPLETQTVSLPLSLSAYDKIVDHVPSRNERNVSRSTQIILGVSEAVNTKSVATADMDLIADSIRIQDVLANGSTGKPLPAKVRFSQGDASVTLIPAVPLGAEEKKQLIRVTVTKNVLTQTGAPLLSDDEGYSWDFEVNGLLDQTPPFVETFLPRYSTSTKVEQVPPNALIQVTFNESLDPQSFQDAFIAVFDEKHNVIVDGHVVPGNRFRTLSFVPSKECGKNACGEPMYCLPASSSLKVTVKTATKDGNAPSGSSKAAYPFTGVVDTAGNALDGGGARGSARNGSADNSPADDFIANFSTTAELDLRQPTINAIGPARDAVRVSPQTPIEVVFSKMMDVTSIHTGTIQIRPAINYSLNPRHDFQSQTSKIIIDHDPFLQSTAYAPEVLSDVRDSTQNCFSQCLGPR